MRLRFLGVIGAAAFLALTAATLAEPIRPAPKDATARRALDANGDPLPPGATARFGSLRWRMAGAVWAVAVSPDGRRAASVDMTGLVVIWDLATGRRLHELAGSPSGEGCLAFSADGKYLATGGRMNSWTGDGDYRVRVWEVSTGRQCLAYPLRESAIWRVAFSPDGTRLVSSGCDQPVTIWEFPSGKKLREFPSAEEPQSRITTFALSPNGRWLAEGDADHTVCVRAFDTGRPHFRLETEDHLHGLYFSPDSRSLLVVECQRISCWEVRTGKQRWQSAVKDAFHLCLHPSPDGRKIAVSGRGIQWLDPATGKLLTAWGGPAERVGTLDYSPDGRTLVSGEMGALRVWDAATGKIIRGAARPTGGCYSLAFSADGKTLVAGSTDLHFLDGRTLRERSRSHIPVNWGLALAWESVDLSPDGKLAAAIGPDGEIVLVDSGAGKLLRTLRRPGWFAESVAFAPDGRTLYAVGRKDASLRVWDVSSGEEGPPLCRDLIRTGGFPVNLTVAHQAAKLATVSALPVGRCRLWDLRTGREELPLADIPHQVLLSRDGKFLAAYHYNSHVNLWDVARRVKLHRFDFGFNAVIGWTFSADGRFLVTGHPDGAFRTFNLATGRQVAEVRGHLPSTGIIALAASPDGTGLVSASTDCTVLRWESSTWQGK